MFNKTAGCGVMSDKGPQPSGIWVIGGKSWLEGEIENKWPRIRERPREYVTTQVLIDISTSGLVPKKRVIIGHS